MTMKINSFDTQQKTLIIAEIGNNHEGDFSVAEEMVRQAAACGVDAVKFQTVIADLFVNPTQSERLTRMRKFQLPHEQFAALGKLAKELGLLFISTPLDIPSAKFLSDHVDAFKIASGDITFFPMIDCIAGSGKPIIMSTGICTLDEIHTTVSIILSVWQQNNIQSELAILHCVSNYPVPNEQINLRSIPFLQEMFSYNTIGFSDHTLGIDACTAAVSLGATIIEKHFTLDKQYSNFRDHQLSADPTEMKELVSRIRTIEPMLGRKEKAVQPCELDMVNVLRRSITIKRNLPSGHVITEEDLIAMRPGNGIQPGQESYWIGKTLIRHVAAGELLAINMVA